MNYQLTESEEKHGLGSALLGMGPLLRPQRRRIVAAGVALVASSLLNLSGPALAGYAIDHYLVAQDYAGVLRCCGLLLLIYALASLCQYGQTLWMGGVGQHLLFSLRKQLFEKLQELPLAFFHSNRAGDLISRLNQDTDKVNAFFTQSLVQFVASLLGMSGAAIFLLSLQPKLGFAALWPALLLIFITVLLGPILRRRNRESLDVSGSLSAEVADSLENFKAIVAYHRRDYFRQRFQQINRRNYQSALIAGIFNRLLAPLYTLCQNLAQLSVLFYGLLLIAQGQTSVGLLISFLTYVARFYDPLRQIAANWASFQTAMAGWERIAAILRLQSNLPQIQDDTPLAETVLEFQGVDFEYTPGATVLSQVEMKLEQGKTYALVGPTGGGKTTTASLMARLYDPTRGQIRLYGRDLRAWSAAERSQKLGFILQEPFLFEGSLRENLSFANADYSDALLEEMGMGELLTSFPQGLESDVMSLSLGQRQIVAFMRAVLRRPDLLILDEASANIDTVTESTLGAILKRLPGHTTLVVIAHRLNTIENADEIFFVNGGRLVPAGSMSQALAMLHSGQRLT